MARIRKARLARSLKQINDQIVHLRKKLNETRIALQELDDDTRDGTEPDPGERETLVRLVSSFEESLETAHGNRCKLLMSFETGENLQIIASAMNGVITDGQATAAANSEEKLTTALDNGDAIASSATAASDATTVALRPMWGVMPPDEKQEVRLADRVAMLPVPPTSLTPRPIVFVKHPVVATTSSLSSPPPLPPLVSVPAKSTKSKSKAASPARGVVSAASGAGAGAGSSRLARGQYTIVDSVAT